MPASGPSTAATTSLADWCRRLVAALVLGALVAWAGLAWRERQRWNGYLEVLRAEPGIVVVSAERTGGKFVVSGLRDARAARPDDLLRQTALDPAEVEGRWRPYQALEPPFVLAAAREALQPPASAALDLADGVLRVSGQAPAAWLLAARERAPLVAGVVRLDASAAVDGEIRSLAGRIEAAVPLFVRGTSQLAPGQEAAIAGTHGRCRAAGRPAGRQRPAALGLRSWGTPTPTARHSPTCRSASRAPNGSAQPWCAGPFTRLTWSVSGAGSSQPVVAATSEPAKQRNRRANLRVEVE